MNDVDRESSYGLVFTKRWSGGKVTRNYFVFRPILVWVSVIGLPSSTIEELF
jgi:hypothetical protein